ncbi:MAG: hypothetical protein R8G01_00480 [Ilumatobacteraceae bacterium]|nr:hypothetical protein [Ilumatobacteraceae bacterium]
MDGGPDDGNQDIPPTDAMTSEPPVFGVGTALPMLALVAELW